MFVLDIGCGSVPHAITRGGPDVVHADLNKTELNKRILEIQCSIYYLPLRNKTFDLIQCSHVLEHLTNPLEAVKEMKRVSNRAVIKVPNLRASMSEYHEHIFTWSKQSLKTFLKLVYDKVEVKTEPMSRGSDLPFLARTFNLILNMILKRELIAYASSEGKK